MSTIRRKKAAPIFKDIQKYMKDLKSKDFKELPQEEQIEFISRGMDLVELASVSLQKRTMKEIMEEQAGFVRMGTIDIPNPINAVDPNDIETIKQMVESRKATQEAVFKGIGTVITLLASAAMLAA